MKGHIFVFFASFVVACECLKGLLDDVFPPMDPDENRNVTQLIASKGYPVQDHTVQTADGYLLSLQRIPHGANPRFSQTNKKPILLLHALYCSADEYVLNFPHQSLGFILADNGYDVWLGNVRGNTYSRRNVKYSPDLQPAQFFNYSFTEMGLYDVPAMIDYILDVTGEETLYYVGHSQGTTAAMVMLSERPEYNEKLRLCVFLAPIAFVGHIRGNGPFRVLAPFENLIRTVSKIFGTYELMPNDAKDRLFRRLFCNAHSLDLCESILFKVFSPDKEELNKTRLPVYTSHIPAGTSTKSVVHYLQLVNSDKFRKYDYKEHNIEHYQQATPPDFDLSAITAPIALFWGRNDLTYNSIDMAKLRSRLRSVVYDNFVPFRRFNHLDFALAVHANKLLYTKVLKLLSTY